MTYVEYAKFMQRVNNLISTIEDCDVQFDNMHDECTEALKRAGEIHDDLAAAIPAYYAAWQVEASNALDIEETGMDPHGSLRYMKGSPDDYTALVDLENRFGIKNDDRVDEPELIDKANPFGATAK